MTNIRTAFTLCGLSLLPLALCGCCSTSELGLTDYDNSFWNVTGETVSGVHVFWEANGQKFMQEPDDIPVAKYDYVGESMVTAPLPIPEKVRVTWKTADGTPHEQTVAVASRIPDIDHFRGSIFYKFTDQGVMVVPYTYEYQERNVKQGKAAVP